MLITRIYILLFATLPITLLAQVDVDGYSKVYETYFNDSDKQEWLTRNNLDYEIFVEQNTYHINSYNNNSIYLLPGHDTSYNFYKISAEFKIKDLSKDATFGVCFNVTPKLVGGYVIEFNNKREFRLKRLGFTELIEGEWMFSNKIPRRKNINLELIVENRTVYLFIDHKPLAILPIRTKLNGYHGFYMQNKGSAKATYFGILGKKVITEVVESENGDEKRRSESNNEFTKTLTAAITEERKKSNELEKRNIALMQENTSLKKQLEELQNYINSNLDLELKKKIELFEGDNKYLKEKLESAEQEIERLKEFKKSFEQGKDADVVIVLSENLQKQIDQTESLKKKIEMLEAEIKKLKNK